MQAPLAFSPGPRADRDLGPVAGLAGQGGDLDPAVGDLGHLEREQLADQAGVGPGEPDLRPAQSLANAQYVATQPLAVLVALARHLLGRGQHRLDPAEVDEDVARVLALLDDPADDVALLAGELAQHLLVLGVAQPLHDDLPGRGRRDPAEAVRGVVELRARHALLVGLVGPDHDVPALAVELHAGVLVGALGAVVGDQQRLLDRRDQDRAARCPSRGPGPARPPGRCPSQPSSPGVASRRRRRLVEPGPELHFRPGRYCACGHASISPQPKLRTRPVAGLHGDRVRGRRRDPAAQGRAVGGSQVDQPAHVAAVVPGQRQGPLDARGGDLQRVRRALERVIGTGEAVEPLADQPGGLGDLVQAEPLDRASAGTACRSPA